MQKLHNTFDIFNFTSKKERPKKRAPFLFYFAASFGIQPTFSRIAEGR